MGRLSILPLIPITRHVWRVSRRVGGVSAHCQTYSIYTAYIHRLLLYYTFGPQTCPLHVRGVSPGEEASSFSLKISPTSFYPLMANASTDAQVTHPFDAGR